MQQWQECDTLTGSEYMTCCALDLGGFCLSSTNHVMRPTIAGQMDVQGLGCDGCWCVSDEVLHIGAQKSSTVKAVFLLGEAVQCYHRDVRGPESVHHMRDWTVMMLGKYYERGNTSKVCTILCRECPGTSTTVYLIAYRCVKIVEATLHDVRVLNPPPVQLHMRGITATSSHWNRRGVQLSCGVHPGIESGSLPG